MSRPKKRILNPIHVTPSCLFSTCGKEMTVKYLFICLYVEVEDGQPANI